MAGFKQHNLMVAADGMDVVAIDPKRAYFIDNFLAGRSAIYGVAQQVNTVGLLQTDDFAQQVAEGSDTAMNIRYDKTTGLHGFSI